MNRTPSVVQVHVGPPATLTRVMGDGTGDDSDAAEYNETG